MEYSPVVEPQKHSQLIFDKGKKKAIRWIMIPFSINDARTIGCAYEKRMNINQTSTFFYKAASKWVIDFNVKHTTKKFLEENMRRIR